MPSNTAERVENASRMIDFGSEKGIAAGSRSTSTPSSSRSRSTATSASIASAPFRELRARYGTEIHLTGGMSNVSFGLPGRRLINDVFLALAIEAGADSGIIDPVTNSIDRSSVSIATSHRYQLAPTS